MNMKLVNEITDALKATGKAQLTRSDIWNTAKKLGLKPFKTLDHLQMLGRLKFHGTCCCDGFFTLHDPR